ncbi:RNA polymerase sigma factor [Spirosoma sp. BT702]|uniref:RNA polymerase sigma factor n=1 Tax=Spirosoma profusum TaxID=2771354 RepID=A0A926Y0M0_9BACT|nr:RNA polymerase sigma factor [Spirosoma profusum]MBD2701328.1 RNA polymerase sigma factor [Spirosoma profusum]
MKNTNFLKYNSAPSHQFDTSNFEELYRKYVKKVYQKCLSMTKSVATAQDCTQEIFLKVFANRRQFKNNSHPSTWLYAITQNHCLDLNRIEKRLPTSPLPDSFDADAGADDYEAASEQSKLLAKAMRKLSAEDEALMRLKYEQNYSIQQLSQQFGLSESAIKMRLKRSRDKVKELLNKARSFE